MFIPDVPLKLVYNTRQGLNYIPIIAPFFLLYYIQAPLTSTMQAIGRAKEAMYGTMVGGLIKTILLVILSLLKIGLWSLIIASLANIFYITIQHYYYVKKYLKKTTISN